MATTVLTLSGSSIHAMASPTIVQSAGADRRRDCKSKLRVKLEERRTERKRTIEKLADVFAPHRRKSLTPSEPSSSPLPSPALSPLGLPTGPRTPRERDGLVARCKRRLSSDAAVINANQDPSATTAETSLDSRSSSSTATLVPTLESAVGDVLPQATSGVSAVPAGKRAATTQLVAEPSLTTASQSQQLRQGRQDHELLTNEFLALVAIVLAVSQVALLLQLKGVCPLS